jgi:uncharacterized protein (TIGR01777 family)
MRVLVSGASGLVGSALVRSLEAEGNRVTRLVRSAAAQGDEVGWDPGAGRLDPSAIEGIEAAVHLSGESVAGRWSAAKKERILESRTGSTRLLAETLAGLEQRPSVLVCASAVGYYGDRGDEELTERSPAGSGFLADVVRQWEAAAEPARAAGIRVVSLRFGVVLSPDGGALRRMLPPFRLGVGGRIGGGDQYMSWVAIDDVVGAVQHALETEQLSGPVNATAPEPVTNSEFTKTIGRVLGRPTLMRVPGPALRLALGEFSSEVLNGQRVLPARLMESGYRFRYPQLEGALRNLLGK